MTKRAKKRPHLGTWGATGWTPPSDGLSWDEYERVLTAQRRKRLTRERKLDADLWQLADMLNWGMEEFGEDWSQLVDEAAYERETLNNIARIGEGFPTHRRWDPGVVSFWTHAVVLRKRKEDRQALPEDVQDELLARYADPDAWSEDGLYSRQELRDEVEARLYPPGSSAGASGDDGGGEDEDGLDTCPLCDGAARVSRDRRRAYLMEEEGYSAAEAAELAS